MPAFEAVLPVRCGQTRGVFDRENVRNFNTHELTHFVEAQPILDVIEIEHCRVE